MTTSPNALPATLDAATLRELVDSGRAPRMLDVRTLTGAGLTFAAVTDTRALGMLLGRLPYDRGASCDVETVVGRLGDHPTPRPLP
ncbi:hypothetical protein [Micromonospora echinofusca]|uniref:hypothetical protein n=1 Tax=Micromonospora echinofusca TaxID=47858 RepID=UPI0012FDB57B|nr:hypothetical protein [Micromonospora echinofusca]